MFLFLMATVGLNAQNQEEMGQFNYAYNLYSGGDGQSAVNHLNQYINSFNSSPGYWLGDAGHIEFVFRVYGLAITILADSGNSGGADQYLDQLVYLMSDIYYESDVINAYNSTYIGPY